MEQRGREEIQEKEKGSKREGQEVGNILEGRRVKSFTLRTLTIGNINWDER